MRENKTVGSLTLAKEILKRGNCVRIPTLGRSMFPLISNIVLIEPATAKDIKSGDVAVYSAGKRMIAHRLVKKATKNGKEILLTKGDTFVDSSEVLPENVIGKVIGVEKWGIKLNLKKGAGKLINILCSRASPILPIAYPILRDCKHWFVWRVSSD
ncbi:MAG: signal peptidase I [Pseudomonadota bacterium]